MKKLTLVLCIATVLVVAPIVNNAVAGPWVLCQGTVTYGLYAPYQPAAGAMVTCVETGWTAMCDANGHFDIYLQGYTPAVGTYHVVVTKAGVWRTGASFYYDWSPAGANVDTIQMRLVD